jgi:hypothetical protein
MLSRGGNTTRMALLLLLLCSAALSQGERAERCTQYHASRVGFLLGCCGDQRIHYPGPPFPDSMDEVERATRALREVEAATRLSCYTQTSRGARLLTLNGIGAHIMRAQARARFSPDSIPSSAQDDIKVASDELRRFVRLNPTTAVRIWAWIAVAFQLSGQLWDSLMFLNQLPKGCCDEDELNALRGDLMFDLGIYQAAAEQYSRWLAASPSLCGHSRSLLNLRELRQRGFKVPLTSTDDSAKCAIVEDWQPYVVLVDR